MVLIASVDTVLLEPGPPVSYPGSDAGIWLTPLINRKILSLPYDTNFGELSTWALLRENDITYIYIGGSAESFHEQQLRDRPSLYKLIFSLPGAHVYEVINAS